MFGNYHTHTHRCGHASGTDEEYILTAINAGLSELGFSDHAPYRFPDGRESGHRVPTAKAQEYVESLKALREKYKEKIKIHIGFEMEYYPLFFEDMLSFVKSLGAEYLILGQHYINNESGSRHATAASTSNEELAEYTDCVVAAMESGVFSYIAHPDVFFFTGDPVFYEQQVERLCRKALELDIPLEINLLGVFENRTYPNEAFWKIASRIGNKVIIGMDAHSPDRTFDEPSLKKALEFAQKHNLNLIDKLEIKSLSLPY